MRGNTYIRIWLVCLAFLSWEYFAMENFPGLSLIQGLYPQLTTQPGRQLSLFLGWAGFGTMLTMNVYTIRKRVSWFRSLGQLSSWLNFHIFCGLLGPTLILFHCNFKVRGLVAISFWSMLVSATSGVIGKYLYVKLLKRRSEFENDSKHFLDLLNAMRASASKPISDDLFERMKRAALRYVGVDPGAIEADGSIRMGALHVFFSSLMGDARLLIDLPKTASGMPRASRNTLKNYALSERSRLFLEPFRHLMGYWHTFHLPFAFFMYGAVFIHIIASLLFGVRS